TAYYVFLYSFSFYSYRHYRVLHSFPTRRSSDLAFMAILPVIVLAGPFDALWVGANRKQTADGKLNPDSERPVLASLGKGRHSRRSEEHTSELQSQSNLVCRLLLEKKKKNKRQYN